MNTHHCDCGVWTGESCAWFGPVEEMVVVEFMPEYLRSSHEAARNHGSWPHNGAIRVAVEHSCAELAMSSDPDWVEVLENANPAEYVI